jgi:hypothetical protein
MRNESRGRRRCAAMAVAITVVLLGCGSNSDVHVNSPNGCDGNTGAPISGTVQMPNGKVAQAGSWSDRVSSLVWNAAAAINGDVRPVRQGIAVDLVQLTQDDVSAGRQPGAIEIGATRKHGAYCIGLPPGADENTCRFVVQVGDSASHTLTRAFVFSTTDPIDIDFRSEAAVRVILANIPPAALCDFSPGDIRTIYNAVVAAPGTALGADADEINAVAASLAAQDPGVQAAIAAVVQPPGTATSTRPPGTPTSPPAPSATQVRTATGQVTAQATPSAETSATVQNTPTALVTTGRNTRTPTITPATGAAFR